MGVVILLVIFYGIAIAGIARNEKKYNPKTRYILHGLYIICVAFTCFVRWHVS